MRKPIVSRKLKQTIYKVVCADKITGQPVTTELKLYGLHATDDKDKAIKQLKKQLENTNYLPVKIMSSHTEVKLYGMDPQKFFSEAVELDPVTRTPIKHEQNKEN